MEALPNYLAAAECQLEALAYCPMALCYPLNGLLGQMIVPYHQRVVISSHLEDHQHPLVAAYDPYPSVVLLNQMKAQTCYQVVISYHRVVISYHLEPHDDPLEALYCPLKGLSGQTCYLEVLAYPLEVLFVGMGEQEAYP